jgi:gamma-glutamylcyclotransferase (GGCT)/AIG2-like uncharacterized protein YtfP
LKLFVYGTLTNPETMEEIIQKPLSYAQEAVLKDHIKYDTTFGISVALPKKGSEVKGVIWDNLNENDFEKLDIYEECHLDPPLYLKKIKTVFVKNKPVTCVVYIGNEDEVKKSLIIND